LKKEKKLILSYEDEDKSEKTEKTRIEKERKDIKEKEKDQEISKSPISSNTKSKKPVLDKKDTGSALSNN